MERAEAYKIAQKCAQLLKEQFKVDNVYIFGSVTGDGPWHKWSDIDIAVEGLPPQDYFKALNTVDNILPAGLELDLVTLDEVPVKMKERIRSVSKRIDNTEGIIQMSENQTDRLKWLIESEFEQLERVIYNIDQFLEQLSGREPSIMEMIGVSGSLQNFYNGVEKIFERTVLALYGKLPEGEEWHTMLLQQIESNFIIDHSLFLHLLDYLRFRHRHRHSYGHTLEWARLLPLARDVSDTLEIFRKQIYSFLENYSDNS